MSKPKTLHFIHGSGATPADPSRFSFEMFNYIYDANTKKSDHPSVGSGLDAEGPGIYAFCGGSKSKFTQEQYDLAYGYSNQVNGSVIGFEVDMTDIDGEPILPANSYDSTEIDGELWEAVVERFIVKLRDLERFQYDEADSAVETLADAWEKYSGSAHPDDERDVLVAAKELVDLTGGKVSLSECNPKDYDDIEEWKDNIRSSINISDPVSHIVDEGGASAVVNYAISSSDNLWQVVKVIYDRCAVIRTGLGYKCYNDLFYKACRDELPDLEMSMIRAASVNDGLFYVVFDIDAIKVNSMSIHQHQIPEHVKSELISSLVECRDQHQMLERPQIAIELSKVAKDIAGVALPDDLSERLSRTYEGEPFTDSLCDDIVKSVAKLQLTSWEREPGMLAKYTPEKLKNVDPQHSLKVSI